MHRGRFGLGGFAEDRAALVLRQGGEFMEHFKPVPLLGDSVTPLVLLSPSRDGGMPLMETLERRQSQREDRAAT